MIELIFDFENQILVIFDPTYLLESLQVKSKTIWYTQIHLFN